MAAQFTRSASHSTHCTTNAAACSPARIRPVLDTAILLVVSICVLSVRIILPLV